MWGIGIAMLAFPILGISTNAILLNFGLQFRMWLIICIIVFVVIDIIIVLATAWWQIYRKCKHGDLIVTITLPFVLVISVFVLYFGAMVSAFSYEPEHVVEIKGTKMVARVNSFLDKSADYYPYRNWFVCGKKQIGHAYFGSGGTDPYEYEDHPTPVSCHIEDENGNVLLSYGY